MGRFVARLCSALVVVGFVLAAVVLLWADRGAALGDEIFGHVASAGRRVERALGVQLVERSDLPPHSMLDQIGHAALWGSGTLAIGIALRRRLSVGATATIMAVASLGFEIMQPIVSSSRGFQPSDARANMVGVLAAAFVLGATLRIAEALVERHRVARV